MPKFVYRLIEGPAGVILAVADAELLNRKITDGSGVTIYVNEEFYGDKVGDEDTVRRLMQAADMIVLVGERAVGLAREMGLVAPGSELIVNGVPYVQVFRSPAL